MKNILESGLQWLSKQQRGFAFSPVMYCRDEKEYPVGAVLGRTRYEIVDDNGFTVSSHTTDFLIEATELPFDPQTGDQIIAQESVYEVIDLGIGCWT
jgi:hypothetical protein